LPWPAAAFVGAARGKNEVGIDEASGKELVKVDPGYFRPTEVDVLHGDATKAHSKLGWNIGSASMNWLPNWLPVI
jgi:GDP-D-mannose dehydratase